MATTSPATTVQKPVEAEVPTARAYDSLAAADLDRALCEAIEAAEAARDDYLAQLLARELESHYHE